MTDTQHVEFIYLEDLIGTDYVNAIEHEDGRSSSQQLTLIFVHTIIMFTGWPSMGLRFGSSINESHLLELLTAAAMKAPETFSVFTHDTMPSVYHFSHHPRIAPIYVIPEIGYAITNWKEGDERLTKGVRVGGFHATSKMT